MLKVGLTGNVAAGKSAVLRTWADAGVPVVSADDLAREVVAPGSAGLRAVVEAFGQGVLGPDGSLDRRALRRRVFDDPAARARLEAILHPLIRARRDAWVAEQERRGAPLVVAEIPLLFETGMQQEFDRVVLVDAPVAVRRQRMVEHRGLTAEQADKIIAAQMDPAIKRAMADHVIDNDGTLDDLRAAAAELLETLRAAATTDPA